jgi:hypothetical protein
MVFTLILLEKCCEPIAVFSYTWHCSQASVSFIGSCIEHVVPAHLTILGVYKTSRRPGLPEGSKSQGKGKGKGKGKGLNVMAHACF